MTLMLILNGLRESFIFPWCSLQVKHRENPLKTKSRMILLFAGNCMKNNVAVYVDSGALFDSITLTVHSIIAMQCCLLYAFLFMFLLNYYISENLNERFF